MKKDSRLLIRQNYGIVLENVGVIDIPQTSWHQLFVITIGADELPNMTHPCEPHLDRRKRSQHALVVEVINETENLEHELNLQSFCPGLLAYKDRHDNLVKLITNRQKNIDQLLPIPVRQKRGLFYFIGKISKSFFGTATDNDVEVIKEQIQTVLEQAKQSTNEVHFLKETMQSYMIKENQHTELLTSAIQLNHDSLEAFSIAERRALEATTSTFSVHFIRQVVPINKQAQSPKKDSCYIFSQKQH